jgi:hypothetical protein
LLDLGAKKNDPGAKIMTRMPKKRRRTKLFLTYQSAIELPPAGKKLQL